MNVDFTKKICQYKMPNPCFWPLVVIQDPRAHFARVWVLALVYWPNPILAIFIFSLPKIPLGVSTGKVNFAFLSGTVRWCRPNSGMWYASGTVSPWLVSPGKIELHLSSCISTLTPTDWLKAAMGLNHFLKVPDTSSKLFPGSPKCA